MNWKDISAKPKYPVDISYLVADLKYSKQDGLKICEVQHGALSAIKGDLYISGNDGTIAPMIADFFDRFNIKKWIAGFVYPPVKRSLAAKNWESQQSFNALVKNQIFLEDAKNCPAHSFCIDSYAGIVYADLDIAHNFNFYHKACPGILFINAATFPYWKDKYEMNLLFDKNEELKQYKADWRLYQKEYDSGLAVRIQKEMPSKLYVIKPRGEFLANGVIVVYEEDLDNVLQLILKPSDSLKTHPDKKYSYWLKNNDDTFIIEKYYPSDYLCFPFPLDKEIFEQTECNYDATMRIAFILQYNEEKMSYHPLGGFWKLPSKALEEEGSLNETRISCCKIPFYTAVDPTLLQEVNGHMQRAMLLLYEIMLNE